MASPDRGSVWIADFGLVGKIWPCLILSTPIGPQDRVLVTVIPHTTSIQGTGFEVNVLAPFLRGGGVFDAQQVVTIPQVKLLRSLGNLPHDQLALVEDGVRRWLGF